MVVVLAGAALWPIVAPLVGTGTAATMAGGAAGLLGGPGREFVSGFLKRLAKRKKGDGVTLEPSEVWAALERDLRERLEAQGEESAALRRDVSRLLEEVAGVETALGAASDEVKDALAQGFAELSGEWEEFRWMLGRVEEDLHEIQRRQAESLTLQRASLDLQREQLVKTTILLQRQAPQPPARVVPQDESPEVRPPADAPCPYKGLQAFQPEDAEFFFGREATSSPAWPRRASWRWWDPSGAGSPRSSAPGSSPPSGRERCPTPVTPTSSRRASVHSRSWRCGSPCWAGWRPGRCSRTSAATLATSSWPPARLCSTPPRALA